MPYVPQKTLNAITPKKSPLWCLKIHIAYGFIYSTAQKKKTDESFVSRDEHRVSRGESLVSQEGLMTVKIIAEGLVVI